LDISIMHKGHYTVIVALACVLTACADLNEMQNPAPVFGNYPAEPPVVMQEPITPPVPQAPPILETRPLEGMNKTPELIEIKPDLPPPALPPQTELPPLGTDLANNPNITQPLIDPGAPVPTEPQTEVPNPSEQAPVATPEVTETPVPIVEAPKAPEAFAPLDSFAPQSPAVGSLVMAANENTQSGNYDSAAAAIERAIRIEPRNAALYYKLAVVRLNQSKPRLAEDIARKAALLAADDNNLRKHSWLLIANARELQSNFAGAQKAKLEAAKY
jgi:TPR repeat